MLFCDKGHAGVTLDAIAHPLLTFSNHKWAGKYHVYKWTGAGEKGASRRAGLYMVSKGFLSRLPRLMRDAPFTAVGAWLASMCQNGALTCLSYLEAVDEADGEADGEGEAATALRADVPGSQNLGSESEGLRGKVKVSELSWRDTVVVNPAKVLGGSAALSILNGEDAHYLKTKCSCS